VRVKMETFRVFNIHSVAPQAHIRPMFQKYSKKAKQNICEAPNKIIAKPNKIFTRAELYLQYHLPSQKFSGSTVNILYLEQSRFRFVDAFPK